MIHKNRAYSEPADEDATRLIYTRWCPLADAPDKYETLAYLLAEGRTWCGCNAFKVGNLVLLNDSFSADGAQEYAVFRDNVQIESLTCSWMTREDLAIALRRLDTEPMPTQVFSSSKLDAMRVGATFHPKSCDHCA